MVEVIEELDDLMGSAVGADRGEAHDVAEEDGGSLKHLWLWHLTWIVVFKVLYYIQNFLQPFFSFRMTDVGSKELSNFSVFLFSDL